MTPGNLKLADLRTIAREVWGGWCETVPGEIEACVAVGAVLHGGRHFASEAEVSRIRALAAELEAGKAPSAPTRTGEEAA